MSLSKILFIGLPGSGKGTQAKLLNLAHISTGDIIRDAFARKDPLISKYQTYIERGGGLLPDELIFELVEQNIREIPSQSKGYILDGAVRTLPQAQYAVKKNLIDSVFYFSLSEDEARERIAGRRLKENRKEDNPEVAEKRFQVYRDETMPAVKYLENCISKNSSPKLFVEINASEPIEIIHNNIEYVIKEF